MSLISYKRGQGSIVLRVKILNSSVATGAGLTALTSASSGLIISTIADNEASATAYTVAGSTIETVTTLGTYAAPTATKCRFKEVDSTNHKGVYEIQIADARFAVSSAKSVLVSILGATNAAETDVVIPLTDFDPYDAVRGALTALPNAAAEAAGGLFTRGTGAGQIEQEDNGKLSINVKQWLRGTIPAVNTTGVPLVDMVRVANTVQTAGDLKTLIDAVDDFVDTEITDIRNRLPAALTVNGNLKVSLQEILTTALTEAGAGQLTAAFKKWFDVAAPVGTVNSIPNATAGAAGGIAIVGSAMSLGTDTVDAAALKADAVTEIVTGVFARTMAAAFSSLTFDQCLRVALAVLAGKASGLNTGSPVFRNLADNADVVAATTDTDGNRTAVTITP